MPDYIEQGETKQVIVQRKDGTTWTAEIGLDGRLRLLEQLSDPERPPQEFDDDAEQEAEQEAMPQEAEPEEGEQAETGEAGDQWGEATPMDEDEMYSESDIDKLIEGMGHRGGNNKPLKPKSPKHKLDAEYHKKLKDPAFLSRLQSIMLDNKYARRVRGRTRGKLDMGRLYKVPTKARSVFMQKQERKGKEYNIVLCIDQSGSMHGRPAELAAETALFLIKQFEHLNINIGIIGYSDAVYVHKELNNKKVNYDEIYSDLISNYGGTNDYPALRRAYHMLATAPQGKNILLMLSDGGPGHYLDTEFYGQDGKREHITRLPNLVPQGIDIWNDAGYINYNEKEHLHHLVGMHPEVTAVGIGIQRGGWQIPDHFVIHNVADLKKTVLGVLRKHITRG